MPRVAPMDMDSTESETDTPPLSGWIALPLLLAIAVLATFPGWLPRRVYVPAKALDANDPRAHVIAETEVAAEQIREGQAPLWDPSAGLGEALLEKGDLGVFAPTILPHLLLKPAWTWTLSAALRLGFAGVGLWVLAGRHGLRGWTRWLTAATFMLGAFDIAHLDESLLSLMAWLPWSIVAIEWMMDRVSWPRVIVVSLVFAGQFLMGDWIASMCLLSACAAAVFLNLVRFRPARTLVSLPAILLAIALGLGLAGVQWAPLWTYAGEHGWPVPVSGSREIAMLRMWSLPVLLAATLVLGDWIRRFGPTGIFRLLPWSMALVLLLLPIYQHRGVKLSDFAAARQERARNNAKPIFPDRKELPFVWVAPKAHWYATRAELTAKLSEVSFDPMAAVLLDDDIPADNLEWLDRMLPKRHENLAPAKSFWSITPKVEFVDQSANRFRLRTQSAGAAWIVISGAYADGWTAKSRPAGPYNFWAVSHDQLVLPAYGKLRAIPMSESTPSEIVLEYWPASFRRGVFVSSATVLVMLLLITLSLFRRPLAGERLAV